MTKPNTMRITGGSLVRRRFLVPPLADEGLVRPTPDRVREAVFSMINQELPEAVVLDIFSGSGSHAFEAISRGAKKVVLVEKRPDVLKIIKENIEHLGLLDQTKAILSDAFTFIKGEPFIKANVVFLDPPYTITLGQDFFEGLTPWLEPDALVIFRCFKKLVPDCGDRFSIEKDRIYGGTRVFILRFIH